jgi:AcrR family transcriptional regulator
VTRPRLRDRQRLQTLHSIHEAASKLAQRDGVAEATVERIAADAGVSVRTVFNYYPTKEDAILGLASPRVDPGAVAEYIDRVAEPGLLERTVALLAQTLQTMNLSGAQMETRKELIERFPELRSRLSPRISEASALVEAVFRDEPDLESVSEGTARVLVSLATSIVAVAVREASFAHFPTEDELNRLVERYREVFQA